MTHSQKLENVKFFKRVLEMTNNNGIYVWPDAMASYKVVDGKFVPDNKRSLKVMVDNTTKEFSNQFIVK